MTYEEIYERMRAAYEAAAGVPAEAAADIDIRLQVLAGEICGALHRLEKVQAAAFPQTAAGAALDLHAGERGLTRKPAVPAAGTLTFCRETPLSYDVEIPAGTVCAASGAAAEYETAEKGVLPAGYLTVTVKARALAGGRAYNAAIGAVDTLVAPPAGIESVRNDTAFTGGTDEEKDGDLRRRLLAGYSVLPNGTNCETYRRTALEVPGVAHANVVARAGGIGTAAVYLYGDGMPVTANMLAAVQQKLDMLREINVDVDVQQAEAVSKRAVMYITPKESCSFEEAKAACEAAVLEYYGALTIGEPMILAALTSAVMQTGTVKNCVWTAGMSDYTAAPDQIVTAGEITVLEAS